MEENYEYLSEKHQGDMPSILNELLEEVKKEQLLVDNIKETILRKKIIIQKKTELIDYIMKKNNETKRESALGTIKYTIGRPLEFDDEKVTEDYVIIKEVRTVDKMKIKADLKAGVPLDRAKVGESKSLKID